ncbi:Ig-like domain-containing protein [Roseibium aggregatum]|uniref:Cadherin-like domain-containing protein n=1 Tax=Roseibium aggregatum TaxID=187304 RepID=A0A939J476_9HYPH|nr:Ig-like domain-containing protein [Roseibium aggregatum]MBN9671337.1 cadherin-like domain-containing protein [Roseibium aggregatum]
MNGSQAVEEGAGRPEDPTDVGSTTSLKTLFDSLFESGESSGDDDLAPTEAVGSGFDAPDEAVGEGADWTEFEEPGTSAGREAFEAFAPAEGEGGAIIHDQLSCPCGACGARDEALFKLDAGDGGTGKSATTSAAAPLSDLADYLISGFWDDVNWTSSRSNGSWSHNLGSTGADPNDGVLYYNVSGFSEDSNGLSAQRKALVREVFKLYEATLGIDFEETTSTNDTVVDFFFTDNDSGAYAYSAYYYTNGTLDVSVINVASSWSGGTSTYNDYTLQTIFHEVGHALGLGHQGDYNGTANFGVSNDFDNDSWQASMMSYFSQTENTNIYASGLYLQTPMSVDWMALDALYGSQGYGVSNAFTEDTTWGFNTTVTSAVSDIWAQWSSYAYKTASTIVDSGGIDTLDLSGYSNNTLINLAPSNGLSTSPSTSNIGGKIGNLTIAEGTIIENAIGGAGSETFYGNSADNILTGNGGNDTFHDSGGDDTYYGGSGTDTVQFASALADYTFDVTGSFLEVVNGAIDLVESTVEWLGFSDQTVTYQYVVDYLTIPPNESPVAVGDTGTVGEDVVLTGLDVLANDSDPENDALTIVAIDGNSIATGGSVQLASGAIVTLNADGTLDYDQNGAFDLLAVGETGTETFSYSVSDGYATGTADVTLSIDGAYDNYAPVAANDGYNVLESGTLAGNVFDNDSDPENDALTLDMVNGSQAGVGSQIALASGALLTVNADGTFDYDPNGAFFQLETGETGSDSFTYRISDGQGNYDTATVNVTVYGETPPLDDNPIVIDFEGLAEGSFYGQNNLVFTDLDITTGVTVSGEQSGYSRSFTITAAGEDFDLDSLTLQKAGGKKPKVWIDAYDDGVLVGSQSVTMKSKGAYTLTFDESFDSIDEVVVRGQAAVYVDDIAIVTHTDASVGANAAPNAADDSYTTDVASSVTGNLLDNDSDPDGDSLSVVTVAGHSEGSVTLASGALVTFASDGTFTYDPNGAFSDVYEGSGETDSIVYEVSDGKGGTAMATAVVSLTGTGKLAQIDFEGFAPGVFAGQHGLTFDGVDITATGRLSGGMEAYSTGFTLTADNADFNLDSLSLQKASGKQAKVWFDAYDDGVLVGTHYVLLKSSGTYDVTFDDSFNDIDQVIVRAQGGFYLDDISLGTGVDGTLDGNQSPLAVDDSYTTGVAATVAGNLLDNDSDGDGDSLSVVSVAGQAAGTVTLASGALVTFASDGTFTYDPNGAFSDVYEGSGETDSFVYEVSDGNGGTAMATAVVSLTGTGKLAQIDFEGFAPGTFAGQHGLTFDGVDITATGRLSGGMEAYSTGFTLTADNADFNLDSLSLQKASGKQAKVWFDAYDDGVMVGTHYVLLKSSGAYDVTFDDSFNDIDQVVVRAQGGFYLDDISLGTGVDGTLDGNQSPVAVDDSYTTGVASSVTGNLLDNDSDPDGDSLSVVTVAGHSEGSVTLASGALVTFASDGTFTYDPNGAFSDVYEGSGETDSIVYEVSDGKGGTAMATAVVSLTGTGKLAQIDFEGFAPGVFAGQHGLTFDGVDITATGRLSGGMEAYSTGFTLTADNADFNLDSLSLQKASGKQAKVWFDAYDDGVLVGTHYVLLKSSGAYDVTFDDSFNNIDQVVVRAQGGFYLDDISLGTGVDGTLDANQSPVAVDDSYTIEDTDLLTDSLFDNDSDADGDSMSLVSVGGQSGGTVTLASGAIVTFASDGSFTYDVNGAFPELYAGDTATDSFVYEVSDGNGGFDQATAVVTVSGTKVLSEINFEGFAPGTFAGQSGLVFNGLDITTGGQLSGNLSGVSSGFTISASDVDFDLDGLTIQKAGGKKPRVWIEAYDDGILVASQMVTMKSKGAYTLTFDESFDSVDEIVVRGQGSFYVDDILVVADSDGAQVGNMSPQAEDDSFATDNTNALTGSLLANDNDPESGVSLVSLAGQTGGSVTLASGAIVTFASDGSFTYDPNGAFADVYSGQTATDSFVYEISDGSGGTDMATAEITINGTRDLYSIGFETGTLGEAVGAEDGFVFTDAIVTNRAAGVSEGDYAALTDGRSLSFVKVDGDSFDFEEAVFTAVGGTKVTIVIEGYLDGELVGSESFRVKGNREYTLALDDTIFDTVDEVVVSGSKAIIVDDMELIV